MPLRIHVPLAQQSAGFVQTPGRRPHAGPAGPAGRCTVRRIRMAKSALKESVPVDSRDAAAVDVAAAAAAAAVDVAAAADDDDAAVDDDAADDHDAFDAFDAAR